MEKLLISACLLGVGCRYDGASKPMEGKLIDALNKKYQLVPVCPESLGGLPIPRAPSERTGYRVVAKTGGDVTENYMRGAEETLRMAKLFGCKRALMKQRSPSCGSGSIYDGSFSGTLTEGDGITAEVLKASGIKVLGEDEAWSLLEK